MLKIKLGNKEYELVKDKYIDSDRIAVTMWNKDEMVDLTINFASAFIETEMTDEDNNDSNFLDRITDFDYEEMIELLIEKEIIYGHSVGEITAGFTLYKAFQFKEDALKEMRSAEKVFAL